MALSLARIWAEIIKPSYRYAGIKAAPVYSHGVIRFDVCVGVREKGETNGPIVQICLLVARMRQAQALIRGAILYVGLHDIWAFV